jgi:Protein of unknown function (DUF3160)
MSTLARIISVSLVLGCHPAGTPNTVGDTEVPTPEKASRALPHAIAGILPVGAGGPSSSAARNLARLPQLGEAQRARLDADGFFVAPQPILPGKTQGARTVQPAKHLFQVYERNDYIRFPSYVTVDLAIDLTHQYFDVVLKTLERDHLVPKLRAALRAISETAATQHARARTPAGKRAALAAASYWGTALRLLEEPAQGDRPDAVEVRLPYVDEAAAGEAAAPRRAEKPSITRFRGELERTIVARAREIRAATGVGKYDDWGLELELSAVRPRSHYNESGLLQRYFRSMSLLGLSSFATAGEHARIPVLASALRAYAGTREAKAFDEVLSITDFVVGKPPTTGLREAVALAERALPGFATRSADELSATAVAGSLAAAWAALPQHPIAKRGPVIEPAGQRVFADTLALSMLLPVVAELGADRELLVKRSMGALGAAAMLGSDRARELVIADAGDRAQAIGTGIDGGRRVLGEHDRHDDAYHDTLVALRGVLGADAVYFEPRAWELRMLQSFAGGWAMLRHDTLLYAYEMGAECDAEDLPAPHGWVEPVPETYAALRGMVKLFAQRISAAGIVERVRPEDEGYSQFASIADKTKALIAFLDELEGWSKQELRGEPFSAAQRTEIAMVGGFAEHVLLTFADAYELGAGNDDMAIVADVFTWQGSALEVGVAHPELIYALIPSPEGWLVARGAVLGYRELLVPKSDRLTDEAWRARLAERNDGAWAARPAWLAPISAPAVAVIELPEGMPAQSRCDYYGGSFAL